MSGEALAAAAESLIGAPFRLHGRDRVTGLDCVGVLAAALAAIGRAARLPTGYSLRSHALRNTDEIARACGLSPTNAPVRSGDVLLARTAPCQFHVLIATGENRFVHAHARLKRVVVCDGPLDWQIAGHWRLANVT